MKQMKLPHCVNGVWHDSHTDTEQIQDMSIVRGIAIFNVTRTYDGNVFQVEDIIESLIHMSNDSFIPLQYTKEEILEWTKEGLALLHKTSKADVNIRYLVMAKAGQALEAVQESNIGILFEEIGPKPESISLHTYTGQRGFPSIKHTNYFEPYVARQMKASEPFNDILYISYDGAVLESSKNNILFVKGTTIVAPNHDIYFGYARKLLLSSLQKSSTYTVEERRVEKSEIEHFEAAYITGLTHGLIPVSRIDSHTLSSKTHQVHADLLRMYQDHISNSQ